MDTTIIKLHTGLEADSRPESFVDLGDGKGGFVYNFNVEEQTVPVDPAPEEEEAHSVTRYRYDSLTMEAPKTQNHILATLLAERYPADLESKLVNDYNAAREKLLPSSSKDRYLDFLADRKAIKAMVEADCEAAGIPNTL